MTWLRWVGTGLWVAAGSTVTVLLLFSAIISKSADPSSPYLELAGLAVTAVAALGSLTVAVVIMPIIITTCEDCFAGISSVFLSGGAVVALGLLYWVTTNFDPEALLLAAAPILAAVGMASSAHNTVMRQREAARRAAEREDLR